MHCWLAPSCLLIDAGADVNGIIIVVVSELLFDLILSNLLEVNWCPYFDPLPLLCVSGLLLAASSGSDLMAMNLCYDIWFRVIRGDVFLRFLFEKNCISYANLMGFNIRFIVLVQFLLLFADLIGFDGFGDVWAVDSAEAGHRQSRFDPPSE